MSRFLSIIFSLVIILSSNLVLSGSALAAVGINNGHLESCPSSPNCVVSQDGDREHTIDPITYSGDRADAKET